LLMDLDDFKHINDNYGHDAGDRVLVEVVRSIKNSIRETDTIYRWGGEEFVILLDGMNPDSVQTVMTKILKAVQNTEIKLDSTSINVTTSIGATFFRDEDRSFEDGLKRADQALYESKKNGKGIGTIRL